MYLGIRYLLPPAFAPSPQFSLSGYNPPLQQFGSARLSVSLRHRPVYRLRPYIAIPDRVYLFATPYLDPVRTGFRLNAHRAWLQDRIHYFYTFPTLLETIRPRKPLEDVQALVRVKDTATVQIGAHREGFQHVFIVSDSPI